MIVRRLRRRSVPVHAIDEAHFASLSRLVDGSGRGVIAVVATMGPRSTDRVCSRSARREPPSEMAQTERARVRARRRSESGARVPSVSTDR
jgi:hypothetical protein